MTEFHLDDRPLAKRKLRALGGAAAPPPTAVPPVEPAPRGAAVPRADASMVNVAAKPIVRREAEAEGTLRLSPSTTEAIRERRVKKGDPIAVAQVAAIQAVKSTPALLPLCHPIPIAGVEARVELVPEGVRAAVRVAAEWRTGVEMEALMGVTIALLTAWDMVKYLEKDERGQYPGTRIDGVRVTEKRKEAPA